MGPWDSDSGAAFDIPGASVPVCSGWLPMLLADFGHGRSEEPPGAGRFNELCHLEYKAGGYVRAIDSVMEWWRQV